MSCARRPSLPLIDRASNPAASVGTTKQVIPRGARLAGAGEDECVRRPRAERDEDLLAAQHPVCSVAFGTRLQPAGVGAGAWFGQRVTAELGAVSEARQQARSLFFAAPPGDRLPVEAVRNGDDPAHVRVGAADLLDDQRVRDHVEAHAAVLLGQRRGEEAELGELGDDAAVDRLGAVPLGRDTARSRRRRMRGPSAGSAPARRRA